MIMKFSTPFIVASAFIAAQACSNNVETPDGDLPDAGQPTTCPIVDSRGWKAWVNAMPGPDAQRTLIVMGEVDTPTPGYTFEWSVGVADRSAIPMQRLHLTATPPDGMAAQVITTEEVRYDGPAIAEQYRAVVVMCGEELLADITDVTVAH
ncbi:hypothetical protein PUV54_02390 [Hyphococcus flavus]|uniref:Lipoprotein n=1 Tax=Hyphococcus flavus TaxID=1866326 RepID=A0AAF0CGC5_9PROT|nr:hypothetical protein [Hyphococcus flavus]WDI32038.1 hypothetical protein PUV54_02390 [Hyphococcus flavus]